MNKIIRKLVGKTIKKIDTDYYDGCLIEFTDGSKIVLKTSGYPEEGYYDTRIEEINEK